jgi:UDP-N-acetylmuramyl pentapeptide phosphotransferase/UDP-N-acetylglucosamine-1-phosphate transferase
VSAWFVALLAAAAIATWVPGPLRARAFKGGWFERSSETDRSRAQRRPTHGGVVAALAMAVAALLAGPGEPVARAALVALLVATVTGALDEHHHRPLALAAGRVAAAFAVPLAGARAELTGVVATDVVLTALGALALIGGLAALDRTDGAMPLVAGITGAGLLVAAVGVDEAPVAAVAAGVAGAGLAIAGQALPPGSLLSGRTGPAAFGAVLAAALVGHDPGVAAPTSAAVPLLFGAVPVAALLFRGLGLRLAERRIPPAAALGASAVLAALGAVLVDGGDVSLVVGTALALVPIAVLSAVALTSGRPAGLAPRPRWVLPALAGATVAAVVVAGAAGLAAVDARGDVLAGREHAQAGLSAAREGELEAAQASFAEAEARFAIADDRLSSPLVAVAERTIPGVAQNLRAAGALIDSGRDLALTAVAVADRAGAEDLQVVDGRVPIEAAAEVGAELAEARAVLATTQHRLVDIDSPWLVDEARAASASLATQVADADESIQVAAETTRLLPALLGGDGARRWFVAILSTSELRGAGGLLGNYAVLTADDGAVALERSGGIAELNSSTDRDGVDVALPAVYREQYSSWSPERFWQNLPVTPDFPTMGEAVTTLAPRSDAGPVDGVIGIDPLGLAALLELTGPITVPSWPVPLGPDELAEVLLLEQYDTFTDEAALDAFQTEVVEAVVGGLTAGSLPPPSSLVATLAPAVAGGHLRLFSSVDDEQSLFDRIGADGSLEAPGGTDYFQLVSQNGSESKIDHFLRRAVDYAVEVDPVTGAAAATATVTLTNGAPDSGHDGVVIGGRNEEAVTAAGEMRFFTTVFSPMAVVSVSIDGGPERPVQLGSEQGLFTGTVLHRIPSGATSTLVFRLAGVLAPSGPYELVVGRQPTAHADELTVRAGGEPVVLDQVEPVHLRFPAG